MRVRTPGIFRPRSTHSKLPRTPFAKRKILMGCLSVFPGRTATPRTSALHALQGRPFEPELLLQPADVASVVLNALSLPWTAEVTNVSIRPMQKVY